MDTKIKSHTKCSADNDSKVSLVVLVISVLLAILLFVRIEFVDRKSEATVAKLAFRIQRIEEEMQDKIQNRIMEILQSNVMSASKEKRAMDDLNSDSSQTTLEKISDIHYRQRRNSEPSTSPLSLQQIRQEIDKELTNACNNTDKVCQRGPQGPPGIKGKKGKKGPTGPPGQKGDVGPMGPPGSKGSIGLNGRRGKKGSNACNNTDKVCQRGPQGRPGIKGKRGKKGPTGPPGQKGDVGPMGPQGSKGSIGLNGRRGKKGSNSIQGTKGECVKLPKIVVYPESLDVFINKQATFYCWVYGVTPMKITWSRPGVGGTSFNDTFAEGSVLHISNVSRSHVGSYMCTANTSYGILKTVSSLHVKELPVFTSKPVSKLSVSRGSTLSLCCEAAGSPPPKIEWSRAESSTYSRLLLQQKGCLTINTAKEEGYGSYTCRATNSYGVAQTSTLVTVTDSCNEVLSRLRQTASGQYKLKPNYHDFWAYCNMTHDGSGWTLIARFSNSDGKNWMRDDGQWWYNQNIAIGTTTDPSINADMISPAFWSVTGRELKITRSDDSSHTPLLQTTGNCLGGKTFRSKITGHGNFRHGQVWSSNQCLGSCTVQYGGQYTSTDGFQQAQCSGGIQSNNKIGFWCSHRRHIFGDGAVMMIGGGGDECGHADHGIGITETNGASFIEDGRSATEYDFGFEGKTGFSTPSKYYALNLWIR